jgi:DNA polymerase III delta prime subunit
MLTESELIAKLAQQEENFQARVAERAKQERERETEVRKKAEEALDHFYDERTDSLAHVQSLNRSKEEQLLQRMEEVMYTDKIIFERSM